jgi:hypothetical protein
MDPREPGRRVTVAAQLARDDSQAWAQATRA